MENLLLAEIFPMTNFFSKNMQASGFFEIPPVGKSKVLKSDVKCFVDISRQNYSGQI